MAIPVLLWGWWPKLSHDWKKRRAQERVVAAHAAKQAAARSNFEERFSGWPEFSQRTSLMIQIISAEEDRGRGFTRDDVPSWPEFVVAASAARGAAESLWEGWREEAIRVTTPPAKLREPIDYEAAYEATVWLRLFCQEKGTTLSRLASSAGITDDYVRRLRGES